MKDIMQGLTDARPAHLSGAGGVGEEVRRRELGRAFSQPREAVRRRGHARRLVPAVAAGAIAVTAAVLVAGTGGGTPTPGRSTTAAPFKGDSVLLAAADVAAKQPMGKYWYTDQITGASFVVKGGYAVTCAHDETFEWTAVKAGGGHLFYGRDLPARPLTAEDEAAWRKAGSPTISQVWNTDHYTPCATKAGSWKPDINHSKGGKFFVPGTAIELTAAQAQNLPTDPARLAKMFLLVDINPDLVKRAPILSKWLNDPAHVVLNASEAFANAPLPPKVRAALMRALAVRPGVRNLGTMTDPLGRRAIAFGADWADGRPDQVSTAKGRRDRNGTEKEVWTKFGYTAREVLLFDPRTGEYLGDEQVLVKPGGKYRTRKPGFVLRYDLLRSSGWTDKKPSPPSGLPFK